MASKRPQQNAAPAAALPAPRGGVAPTVKKKSVAAAASVAGTAPAVAVTGATGKNRRALLDIGNVVPPHAVAGGKINRPITRSFGAQLLAQAAAAGKKNTLRIAPAPPVRAPAAKKKTDHVVIDIRDDSDGTAEQAPPAQAVKVLPKKTKKKVHTMTAVLTARSKLACGLVDKPKQPTVDDIDAADAQNQLAVVEYIEDLYKFYKSAESAKWPRNYMGVQTEINDRMRAVLADWIIEVHGKFELTPETLYLTIYIVDRYLSLQPVQRRELQLVGVAAMLIASKYEEFWPPEVADFVGIAAHAYTGGDIRGMEKMILDKLEWNLTVPTPYVFLVRFIKAASADTEMEHMAHFFAELGLLQYTVLEFCPSVIAASAVLAARCTLKKSPLWTDTLCHYTGYKEHQLLACTEILVSSHAAAPANKLRVVYEKYSSEEKAVVARQPAAKEMIEMLKSSKK